MRFTITSLAAFAATTTALSVTSPSKNDDIDLSKSTKIEWDSVSSDPSSFSIRLVNMNNYPNTNTLVAENVKADEGSYILDDFAGIDSGSGFQINLVHNDDQNNGILAQSGEFSVKGSASTTSASTSTTSSTNTAITGKTKTKSCASHSGTHTHKHKHKPTSTASCTRSSHSSASTTLPGTATTSDTPASPTSSEIATAPMSAAGSLRAATAATAATAGSLLMGVFFWAL